MSETGRRAVPLPWPLFASELVGTAVLVLLGLSLVIVMFGDGSAMARLVPGEGARRLLTGFLFGTVGGALALSPVGKVSGAHINPAVTFGFYLVGRLDVRVALGYVAAQLAGAVVGCLPLLAWGAMGRSVAFGATLPGPGYGTTTVLLGEVVTTFGLIAGLCVFLGLKELRRFTPALMPFLYAVMVFLEAPVSGTSTNPARSFGPAVVSGRWQGWWVYWLGPAVGTVVAIVVCSLLRLRVEVAKLYHFDRDPGGVFHMMARLRVGRP
jgi:aquaporin Z